MQMPMGNIKAPHGWEFIDAGGDEKPVRDIKFVWPNLCTQVYYPVRACAARGRVIVLSVSCLSAPTQDFEQNRLVYGLYLLRMSQKILTYTYLTNESVLC